MNIFRLSLAPIFVALCIAKLGSAHPIVEFEQIDALPDDNVEIEIIDAESDTDSAERNARQFNFGVGFGGYGGHGHSGHGGGYHGNGGYGGYNGYGGYQQNHGYGNGYYAPGYGQYNPGYGQYNNHHNGYNNHHHGYDHHHHHHNGHFRAFNDEFAPELMPNYYPQRPYIAYADEPPRVFSPGFLGPKPIQNEVQIPVSVINDNPGVISPIQIPVKQDEVYKPEFINKEVIHHSVEFVQKEVVKDDGVKTNEENKIKDEKTEKEECTCKNKKDEKTTTEKKN